MLFQETLQNRINKYIGTKTLPRTIMLEGEWGCGKKTLAKYISDKLGIELMNITSNLNLELLESISLSVTSRVYLIEGSALSIKEQNIILKFLEEPLKNSYIILTCENRNLLLNTVINRCVIFEFESYTDAQLKEFLTDSMDPSVLLYARTPGRITQLSEHNLNQMTELATKILTQIQVANYSNIMKIPNNLNFSSNTELLDFTVFSYILLIVAMSLYKEQKIPYEAFNRTSTFYNECSIPRINKQHLFEHYLISLKRVFERK